MLTTINGFSADVSKACNILARMPRGVGGDYIKRQRGFVFPERNCLEAWAHVPKGWPHPVDKETRFCICVEEVLCVLPLTCVWMDGPTQDGQLCLGQGVLWPWKGRPRQRVPLLRRGLLSLCRKCSFVQRHPLWRP